MTGQHNVARWLVLALLPPVPALAQHALAAEDAFSSQLEHLRRQAVSQVGRAPLVAAYEQLLREHPGQPRAAEAMLDVGHLFSENEWPALGIRPDKEKGAEWFRRAADAAADGSETWLEAHFLLAARARWPDTAKARGLLEKISEKTDRNSPVLAKVEYELQMICQMEGDVDGAEKHCRRVLAWYDDPARVPKGLAKTEIDGIRASSAASMVHALLEAPWPAALRAGRIRALVMTCGHQVLATEGMEALGKLEKHLESEATPEVEAHLREMGQLAAAGSPDGEAPGAPVPAAPPRPAVAPAPTAPATPPPPAGPGTDLRLVVAVAGGVVLVAGIAAVWAIRRRRPASRA